MAGDLIMLASQLVELTQKQDAGSGLAEALEKKKNISQWEIENSTTIKNA